MKKKIHAIACAVLAVDLKQCAGRMGVDIEFKFLEAGLHNTPEKLKSKLQAAIDDITGRGPCDRIIVGYGVCGNGTVGIQSGDAALVIPRVHDCIALFLGGDDVYKKEFKKYPGTYYLSAGWCEEHTEPVSRQNQWAWYGDRKIHFDALVETHGRETAAHTFDFLNSWQKNYQRAAFIETGVKSSGKYEEKARQMAALYHWKYEKIIGSQALLEKLITARSSDAQVLVVPPGHVIGFDPIQSTLAARPVLTGASGAEPVTAAGSRTDPGAGSAADGFVTTGLGIDAGGTHTDAVIYDLENNRTLAKGKSLTTRWDFTVGISGALDKLPPACLKDVELIALSTTLATNAIVENDGQKVGTILMPPPGIDMGSDGSLGPVRIVQGQLDISGREVTDIDPDEIRETARNMIRRQGVTAFAVSGFAGAINPDHEIRIKEILEQETGLFVSCGHELSDSLNFKTRATTAVLNARIVPRLTTLLMDLEETVRTYGIHAPIVVVRGDGALMNADTAKQRPVETILSGPAASVAGARHLTGESDAVVVDMGGTTTDTAALDNHQVALSSRGSLVGGHRTHVRALDIRTTGLGGDSLITFDKQVFHIGPRRVAPISWLCRMYGSAELAIDHLAHHLDRFRTGSRQMPIIAVTGSKKQLPFTEMEKQVLRLVQDRPRSIHELVEATGALTDSSLALDRLEENFIVQRCGFTLTDILHITGEFTEWDRDAAVGYGQLIAALSGTDLDRMARMLMDQGIVKLTLEILKRQISDQVDPAPLDNCPVCRYFLDQVMGEPDPRMDVTVTLNRPIIGIGAPIRYFLPRAGKLLNARVLLPEDADVANAIGAITSRVVVRRQIRIVPGDQGGFLVEGVSGTRLFRNFDAADRFARSHITRMVREQARQSGTSSTAVELETRDRMPKTAAGDPVFVERLILASLTGRPDRVMAPCPV